MPRRGAALIIAIAVLAALLFLALPFLYSQSASVAGARAGGWDGTARRAQGTAEGIAAAAAIYATGVSRAPSLQVGTAVQNYTALPGQIANVLGIYAVADTAFRTIIETDKAWTDPSAPATVLREALDDPGRVLHGALIEDESRRIDPNGLGERAWAVILQRAGVQDPYTIRWAWPDSTATPPITPRHPAPAVGDMLSYGDWRMVSYGRLARALARWRPGNSGGRFASLSDLLGADPNTAGTIPFGPPSYDPATGLAQWPYAGIQSDIATGWNAAESDALVLSDADNSITKGTLDLSIGRNQLGYRTARLTQVELERLRPYLTFHALGQGRGGLLDVGSIVAIHPEQNSWDAWNVLSDLPTPLLTNGSRPLWRNGAWIRDADGHAHFGGFWQNSTNSVAQLGEGLGLDVPPALSVNVVPASSALTLLYSPPDTTPGPNLGKPTAGTLFDTALPPRASWPLDPAVTPLTAVDQIPLLRWLDPRAGDGTSAFERPALGTGGWGVMTIEGSATAIDPSGRAQAQRRRRVVMQTVPQERPIEAAWSTQAELEALIRQRQGSWIQAGPHPTSRIANWGGDPALPNEMTKLANAGWIEPAPVCSFTESSSAVRFDWAALFGLNSAEAWGSVLGGAVTAPDPKTVLTPQGVKLSAGDQLAWTVDTTAGPLRFGSNVQYQEMQSRHVALRFCFPTVPAHATIIEARAQDPGADTSTPADGVADAKSDAQSVWRVEYRHADQELVLIMANAALPWTPADRTRFGIDAWKTGTDSPGAAEDGRCLAGTLDFAPADPATRVEFHYIVKGGLVAGRWYHLQAFCASDRPGLHGLILDGIVGRDAIAAAAATETGDHYTFPSLRLSAAIAATVPATAGGAALTSADLSVELPPTTLTLPGILPSRGLVRIDDEFFSYTGISGSTLTGVQRARRVNTNQGSTTSEDINGNSILDPGEDTNGNGSIDMVPSTQCWPVTQAHAQGAMVAPGWSQSPIQTGPWLRGQVQLKEAFQPQPTEGTVSTAGWPGAAGHTTFPLTVTIAPTSGVWPASGYVDFTPGGVAAFSAAGNVLTLEWTGPQTAGANPDILNAASVHALLISMSVTGTITDSGGDVSGDGVVDRLFADGGALQLISPVDGSCEWVRFTTRADRDAVVGLAVGGKYFLRSDGWKMPAYPLAAPLPLTQSRGAMRTPWRQTDWPADVPGVPGTRVLPVQNLMDNTDRFEDSDIVTIVPRVAGRVPVQVVVRHAARDTFPATGSEGAGNDTSNEWFALAHRVPDSVPDPVSGANGVVQTALIGRGWSGDDLSMIGNDSPRRGALPMLRLLASAPPARLFVGCPDAGGFGVAAGVIIDDLCAGPLSGSSDANAASPQADIIAINGSSFVSGTAGMISALAGALPVRVEAAQPIFTLPDGNLRYGLALIDGEVFAWRKESDTTAVLIARGLLGSARMEHRLAPALGPTVPVGNGPPSRVVQPTLPIVILPMGPVAELCSNLPATLGAVGADVVEIDASSYYQDPVVLSFRGQGLHAGDPRRIMGAPFQLVAEPEGGAVELLKLYVRPASNQRLSAPWLRGLYGTSSVAWTGTPPAAHPATWTAVPVAPTVTWPLMGSGTVNPIVIGWWPRFAPGLPGGAGLSADERSAQLRSRVFAWAGFPLRLHGARFDPTLKPLDNTVDAAETLAGVASTGVADVMVASAAGCTLEARALATGTTAAEVFDWETASANLQSFTTSQMGMRAPFNWSRFTGREVDGAELRIHWYAPAGATTFDSIAAAQGCTPRLGADDTAAAAAPAGTAAVRLRCVAPTCILAIEEVR